MTPKEQALSWSYAQVLAYCSSAGNIWVDGFWHDRIEQKAAEAYRFFDDSTVVSGVGWFLGTDNGEVPCGYGDKATPWLKDALALWGWSSPVQFLCDVGAERDDGRQDCIESDAKFKPFTWANAEKAIKDKVYGGKAITLSATADYVYNRDTFFQGCMGGSKKAYDGSATDGALFSGVKIVQADGSVVATNYYSKTKTKDDSIYHKPKIGGTLADPATSVTCGDLVGLVNDGASQYAKWAKANPDTKDATTQDGDEASEAGEAEPTCGSVVDGIGWIVCPVLDAMGGFNDWAWGLVKSLLKVNPLKLGGPTKTDANQVLYDVWSLLLNFANVVLVIIFLLIIYGQVTGGMSNYNVKKMLPKLLLMAVAVNLSFYIVAILVDIFNILGSALYDTISAMTKGVKDDISWGQLVGLIVGASTGAGAVGIGLAVAGGAKAALILAVPTALMALLGFITALLTLVVRQALIPLLAVLAPLAFAAAILPNTEHWFKKWWSMLISMLALYPMAALLFAGVQLSARIVASDEANWFTTLIALLMMGAPLFLLPFLARQTGPMLGKLNGAMNGLAGKLKAPVGKWAGDRGKLAAARYDASEIRRNKRGNVRLRDSLKAIRRGSQTRARERDIHAQAYNAERSAEFNAGLIDRAEGMSEGHGAVGQDFILSTARRAEADAIKNAELSMSTENWGQPGPGREPAPRGGNTPPAGGAKNRLYAAGGLGVQQFRDSVTSVGVEANAETVRDLRSNIRENHGAIKSSAADQMAWAASERTMGDAGQAAATWAMSDADFMGQNWRSQAMAIRAGAIQPEQARRIIDDETLRSKIDPNVRTAFEELAARAPATPAQPVPATGGSPAPAPASTSAATPAAPTRPTMDTLRQQEEAHLDELRIRRNDHGNDNAPDEN